MLDLEVSGSVSRFREIEPEWRALHDRLEGSVFCSHAFLTCWLDAYEFKKIHLVLIWRQGALVGAACLRTNRSRISRHVPFESKKLEFLESLDTGMNDVLIDGSVEGVADALLAGLRSDGNVKIADFFPFRDGAGFDALTKVAGKANALIDCRVELKSAVADLDGGGEQFLLRRSASTRKKLRSLIRKVEREDHTFVTHSLPDATGYSLLEECFDVARKSWKAEQGTDIAATKTQQSYYQNLLEHLGPDKAFVIEVARFKDQPVAFVFTLRERDTVYGLKSYFDQAFAKQGLGRFALAKSMLNAADAGFLRYNCLRNSEGLTSLTDTTQDLYRCRLKLESGLAPSLLKLECFARQLRDSKRMRGTVA